MKMKEAIGKRHTVRQFTKQALAPEAIQALEDRIQVLNDKHGLHLKLMVGKADAIYGFAKALLGKNVNNCILLAGKKAKNLDIRLGYAGADLVLYAQTLGLNSWWIGGMYDANKAQKDLDIEHLEVRGIIAIGYGENQGKPHKSKRADQIATYQGEAPQWFKDGVEALLLAPTAMNRQNFKVTGQENKVSMTYEGGRFSDMDLGIGIYHFELGAGKDNFEWA